jgi:hypothetical protein
MCPLPFGVHDGSLSDLDDAVTWDKLGTCCGLHEIDVGPLKAMVMNVIGNLAEKDAFWKKHAIGFSDERGE